MILKKLFEGSDIIAYDIPQEALNFISEDYSDMSQIKSTILFLDINMPEITGWEFMEIFKHYSKEIHEQFTIYILSSSVDTHDKDLAENNPLITEYISKPLTREKLKELFPI